MTFPTVFLSLLSVMLGLVIGSFLNVVVYRVPRRESIVWPGSRCPSCGHPIRWRDNLPVIGWLFLRGRCRDCRSQIPYRYPAVEALTGLAFLVAYSVFGLQIWLLVAWAFLAVLIALTFIDLDHYIIPDRIVLPASAVALILSLLVGPQPWWHYLGAGLGAALFLFILALIWPGGMGMGDVKMALLMGLVLGKYVLVAMFLAFVAGGLVGIALIALKRKGRKDKIPFGPYLALGAAVGLLWGPAILQGYLDLYVR